MKKESQDFICLFILMVMSMLFITLFFIEQEKHTTACRIVKIENCPTHNLRYNVTFQTISTDKEAPIEFEKTFKKLTNVRFANGLCRKLEVNKIVHIQNHNIPNVSRTPIEFCLIAFSALFTFMFVFYGFAITFDSGKKKTNQNQNKQPKNEPKTETNIIINNKKYTFYAKK